MAVPAHDERDYDFAKKYNLPVKAVISPETGTPQKDAEYRKSIVAVVWNKKNNTFLSINWGKDLGGNLFVGGGVDDDEDIIACAQREIREETGYAHTKFVSQTQMMHHNYFAHSKNVARRIDVTGLLFELVDEEKQDTKLDEQEKNKFTVEWLSQKDAESKVTDESHSLMYRMLIKDEVYAGDGELLHSGEFTGVPNQEAKTKIIEAFGGKKVVKYKIQDWVFARQRYWGEPFPVVRDEAGKVYMVDESELPVLLPQVDQYEPTGTGESPLAAISEWVNVKGYITDKGTFKQSPDGNNFTRETNTMPQWAGSSWYYLRFLDPHNDKALIDPKIEKAWGEVNVYVGGDHATRHLIYARFWHKFLYDIGVVTTNEPFARLEFLGFILAEDGRKMSKRWGNIINPDDVVNEYGADTLRVYEMFMAPFEQTAAWSTSSIKGSDKFLDRVYSLREKISDNSTIETELHKTIKKVSEDIENFKFNTAVSSMMILVNTMESSSFSREDYSTLLKLLAPFAPHITEQVWHELGNTTFIHKEIWPVYDEKKLVEATATLAIQIAGKMRGTIEINRDLDDSLVIEAVKNHEMYKKYVGENEPKKVIIVKNKIINIVL
jgi:leucyl-tRNA synthetase